METGPVDAANLFESFVAEAMARKGLSRVDAEACVVEAVEELWAQRRAVNVRAFGVLGANLLENEDLLLAPRKRGSKRG